MTLSRIERPNTAYAIWSVEKYIVNLQIKNRSENPFLVAEIAREIHKLQWKLPDEPRAYILTAMLHERLNENTVALRQYHTVRSQFPYYWPAYIYPAKLLQTMDRHKEVREILEYMVQICKVAYIPKALQISRKHRHDVVILLEEARESLQIKCDEIKYRLAEAIKRREEIKLKEQEEIRLKEEARLNEETRLREEVRLKEEAERRRLCEANLQQKMQKSVGSNPPSEYKPYQLWGNSLNPFLNRFSILMNDDPDWQDVKENKNNNKNKTKTKIINNKTKNKTIAPPSENFSNENAKNKNEDEQHRTVPASRSPVKFFDREQYQPPSIKNQQQQNTSPSLRMGNWKKSNG